MPNFTVHVTEAQAKALEYAKVERGYAALKLEEFFQTLVLELAGSAMAKLQTRELATSQLSDKDLQDELQAREAKREAQAVAEREAKAAAEPAPRPATPAPAEEPQQ